jgi:hypothetical protein
MKTKTIVKAGTGYNGSNHNQGLRARSDAKAGIILHTPIAR